MDKLTCAFCGGEMTRLPLPHPDRAMVSDGRCLNRSLEKVTCLECGVAAHARHLPAASVRGTYDEQYVLAAASPASDQARARAYADTLTRLVAPGRRVLEVGCGSGALLRELHDRWEHADLVGLDPAVPASAADGPRISFKRGYFEAFSDSRTRFDLVISVNVIEHVADPAEFFVRVAGLLAPGGRLALFCPASSPPNLELLFHDHLHTFTATALIRLAAQAGLVAGTQMDRAEGVGDFQFMEFRNGLADGLSAPADGMSATELKDQRLEYLQAWGTLEQALHGRIGAAGRVVMFGAGQMAALLRAYAPGIWEKVEMLVMDNAGDAWSFDRPVRDYAAVRSQLTGCAIVVATAPGSQDFVAKRLAADGLQAICFNDLIAR